MEHFIDETFVMKFYLECIDKDEIVFLKGKKEEKVFIEQQLKELIAESKMNNRIRIAVTLWKKLFEVAMSYLSPNKKGYDKLFVYFDSFVEFEELIFASDSFYRDHTLHCLWVYFLGEFLYRKPEFEILFKTEKETKESYRLLSKLSQDIHLFEENGFMTLLKAVKQMDEYVGLEDSVRCVAALTHDLGYPLKKIEKINMSINKVLPYFAIHDFDNFCFKFENIQQEFVNLFIDFIARRDLLFLSPSDNISFLALMILKKAVGIPYRSDSNVKDFVTGIASLNENEKKLIERSFKVKPSFQSSFDQKLAYYNDFEAYQHGIMSAFLLMKNLQAFQTLDYSMPNSWDSGLDAKTLALHNILSSISNHTSDRYRIKTIDDISFLTFVDELEEFSRISRASQNREYVEEFCDTALYMENGWLNVVFEFNNVNLDNLNPEKSFKGRCKRFLSLFDIPNMDENLKIRVTILGKIPSDHNNYVLEIAKNSVDIRVNGQSISIPDYLESTQFFTKEVYTQMK
jgi:hypothetical protein